MRIRSQRVVEPRGIRPADIVIEDGVITAVTTPTGEADVDVGDRAILPGAVDVHVHINEPGRTDWEGFETATKAAAAGGTTTLVDMPLNSIPSTTNVAALQTKLDATHGKLRADVGFWGGVVPGNQSDLEPLWRAGVLGFKCFMVDSGVDEFEWVRASDLDRAFPILARLDAPLLAHAELAEELVPTAWANHSPTSYDAWVASRPDAAEIAAIRLLAQLAEKHGARAHVLHLATEHALGPLRELRAANPRLTVETCAHYLTFASDEIPEGGTSFKCAPPIRSAETRESLWAALGAGEIDFVTTDHSPSPPSMKSPNAGRFDESWGGIASVQLLLRAVWTGARARGYNLANVAHWVSEAPARFANLASKGAIEAGRDADLVVFDPDVEAEVRREEMFHRHQYTPYEGRHLWGRVCATYLRGQLVYDDGTFGAAVGQPLLREDR